MNHRADKWEHQARYAVWRMVGAITATLTLSTALISPYLVPMIGASAIGFMSCAFLLAIAGHDRHHHPGLTHIIMAGMAMTNKQDGLRLHRRIQEIMRDISSQATGYALGLLGLTMVSALI